ncbi:MAG: hypothetical protein LUC33_03155 [Prevotellaceae bacterium]|nr:hypothetical protein [Prevotellaceae bacterium]
MTNKRFYSASDFSETNAEEIKVTMNADDWAAVVMDELNKVPDYRRHPWEVLEWCVRDYLECLEADQEVQDPRQFARDLSMSVHYDYLQDGREPSADALAVVSDEETGERYEILGF